ncbi:uncharacterized protein LOC120208887 [Hibiscus syriacus]|uniref:uncharacterized protein LOC120208887 n=1 Tax=Hibiscus syriacus TaxID=106335 RepID=UPI0019246868|nr:uncharacterized protein LOC120208887 [Hibiscus syriacus]
MSNGITRGYKELLSEDVQRRNVKKNIMEMHIPSESANWVKRSLTGIIKYSFQVEFIRNALFKEGYDVQIARWGYVWNSCVLVLNSHEEMLDLWSKKEEVLKQWFERVEPLLNEAGVPMAFCMAELIGVPLLCWNESFFEKMAGRWGKVVGIHESTRKREDLTMARILLRVESPFDVPEVITLGSYGRSFKVSIKIGSASEYSSSFFSNFPVEDSDEAFSEEIRSEEDVDRLLSDHGEGEACAARKNRLSVDNWIEQGVFSGSGGVSENRQLARLPLDRKGIKCSLPESQKVGSLKVGEFAGLGIRSQHYSADGSQAHSEDSGQSGSKDFSGFISGPAYIVNKFGDFVENLNLDGKNRKTFKVLEKSPITEKVVNAEIEAEEESLRLVEPVTTNLGNISRGRQLHRSRRKVSSESEVLETRSLSSCKRVYSRSRDRRYWYGDLLNFTNEIGGTKVGQRKLDVDSSTAKQICFSTELIADGSLLPSFVNGLGDGTVEREIEGYCSEGECLRPKSGLLIRRKRRARRILFREALDQVSIDTTSSSAFSSLLKEAVETWEVSKLLGVSFKEGKEAFLEKIIALEKGLIGINQGLVD